MQLRLSHRELSLKAAIKLHTLKRLYQHLRASRLASYDLGDKRN